MAWLQARPVDYRIYDKDTDGETKNVHFCDMLSLAKKRGIHPEAVGMVFKLAKIKSHSRFEQTAS